MNPGTTSEHVDWLATEIWSPSINTSNTRNVPPPITSDDMEMFQTATFDNVTGFTTPEVTGIDSGWTLNVTGNDSGLTPEVAGFDSGLTPNATGLTPEGNPCALFDLLVPTVIMSVLLVGGLFGNTISIAVMWRDRNHSNIALLLIVLAISDDLVLMTRYLMNALPTICTHFRVWLEFPRFHDTYLRVFMWGVVSIVHMADAFVVIVLAFNRFLAVKVPHVYKLYGNIKFARLQVLGVYIFSILFNIPRFFEYKVVFDKNGQPFGTGTALGADKNFQNIYKIFLYLALVYILPVIALTFFTCKLVTSIREANRKRLQLTKKEREKNNVTATLVSIVVIFMICHLGIPIRRILEAVYPPGERHCPRPYYYWKGVSPAIVCTNSAVNFFIYCWFSPQFRARVVQLLCKGKCFATEVGEGPPLFTDRSKRSTFGSAKVSPLNTGSCGELGPPSSRQPPQQSLSIELSG